MTRPGARHGRCGGTWRGPVHDEAGAWLVCNACGEEAAATESLPLENGEPTMTTPCTHCGRLRWGPGHDAAHCAMQQAHAEALLEDAAHDAAVTAAQPLTIETLTRFADMPRRLPHKLRTRMTYQRLHIMPPPRRHA